MVPKISVVIPVYNSEKFLRECLNSVKSQSFADWEVIVVDDGSTDGSSKILDEYAACDARFHVIHKANGGVSAARNDGLAAAIGEYVLFVDSDDWLDTDAFRLYANAVQKENADVVITDYWTWKERKAGTRNSFFSKDFFADDSSLIRDIQRTVLYRGYSPYPSPNCGYMFSALWSKLIRRQLLVENNIRFSENLKLYEDGLVALQIFEFAKSVSYQKIPTYHYRILNNSLCHINEQRLVSDCDNILNEVHAFMLSSNEEETLKSAYLARALFLIKKMALRSFFCKSARGSFYRRYKDFKNILVKKPYNTAIKNSTKLKLCGNEKSFGRLMGGGLFLATALMYELRARFLRS